MVMNDRAAKVRSARGGRGVASSAVRKVTRTVVHECALRREFGWNGARVDGVCRLPCRPRNARDTIRRQSSRPVDRRLYTGRCEGLLRGTTTSYKRPTKLRQGPISGRHVPVARLSPRPRVPRGSTCRASSPGVRGGGRSLGRGERSFGEPEAAQKRLEKSRPGLRTRKLAGGTKESRSTRGAPFAQPTESDRVSCPSVDSGPSLARPPRQSRTREHGDPRVPADAGAGPQEVSVGIRQGRQARGGMHRDVRGLAVEGARPASIAFSVRGDSTLGMARGFGRLSTSPPPSPPPPPRRRAD